MEPCYFFPTLIKEGGPFIENICFYCKVKSSVELVLFWTFWSFVPCPLVHPGLDLIVATGCLEICIWGSSTWAVVVVVPGGRGVV